MINTPTAQAVAEAYLAAEPFAPSRDDLEAFSGWLDAEFQRIGHLVRLTTEEVTPEVMLQAWDDQGVLLISKAHNEPAPWLSKRDNLRFRAVHDMAHLISSRRFDWQGEVDAFRESLKLAPTCIQWILASEVCGQAAAAITSGSFADQKLVMLPLEMLIGLIQGE